MQHGLLTVLFLLSLFANSVHSETKKDDTTGQTSVSRSNRSITPGLEYAVFTEFSPETKLLKGGWNTRVFTDTDMKQGDSIRCDFATGIITLTPGLYHITGYSMVVYNSGGEPPEMATIRAPAAGGYSRLRVHDPNVMVDQSSMRGLDNSDPNVISIGSPSTPNLTPSIFETYYATDTDKHILLEHQSGTHPDHTYLRINIENSKWHALARISIRRIADNQ
jgi:hypothetical protein